MKRTDFYYSKLWKTVRKSIWLRQYCLCNKCGRPVYVDGISEWIPKEKRVKGIVHHKIHLTDSNVYDDTITINEDNLEGLCIYCHNIVHGDNATRDNYIFDDNGNITKRGR